MSIVDKVTRTRYTLKEVLKEEWDTSVMPDLSNSEIEKLYTLPSSKNKQIAQFESHQHVTFHLIISISLHIEFM